MTDDLRPAETGAAAGPDRNPAGTTDPAAAGEPAATSEPAATGEPAGTAEQAAPADPSTSPPLPAPGPVATTPVSPAPHPASRRSATPVFGYLVAAILGIAIGAIGLTLASDREGAVTPTPTPAATPTAAPSGAPLVDGNAVGRADAPVTIEVWADYQCPFCRLEDLLFGGAMEREYVMPGIARVVYRDFAFLGQESIDAAVAARCAGRQDPTGQLRYHDTLYTFQQGENQGRFVRENLIQMAQIAGVADADAFEACLDDPAVLAEVQADTAEGRTLGIKGTPTMLLSGPGGEITLGSFSQTWPTLRDAIEAVRVPGGVPSPSPTASPGGSGSPSASPSGGSSPEPSATPATTSSPTSSPSASPDVTPAP